MKLLLTGDSHVWPLYMGCKRLDGIDIEDVVAAPIGAEVTLRSPFFAVDADRIRVTSDLTGVYAPGALIPPEGFQPELCLVSACFHTAHLLWKYFARAVPLASYRDGDWLTLSDALIRAIADQGQHYSRLFLSALRNAGLNVLVLEAPRLFRHNPNLAALRPEVVHYIDRLYRARAREWLQSEGFRWVDVPPEMVAGDGYMLEKYRSEDADDQHHGNGAFGLEMARLAVNSAVTRNSLEGATP